MSLLHGWMPVTVQVITAVVLVVAIGWRSRRWRVISVPVALFVGACSDRSGVLVHRGIKGWPTIPRRWACGCGSR